MIYYGDILGEEREILIESKKLENEYLTLTTMMEMVELESKKLQSDIECKVLTESKTYDDLSLLYETSNEETSKKRIDIFGKIAEWFKKVFSIIRSAIVKVLDKFKGNDGKVGICPMLNGCLDQIIKTKSEIEHFCSNAIVELGSKVKSVNFKRPSIIQWYKSFKEKSKDAVVLAKRDVIDKVKKIDGISKTVEASIDKFIKAICKAGSKLDDITMSWCKKQIDAMKNIVSIIRTTSSTCITRIQEKNAEEKDAKDKAKQIKNEGGTENKSEDNKKDEQKKEEPKKEDKKATTESAHTVEDKPTEDKKPVTESTYSEEDFQIIDDLFKL